MDTKKLHDVVLPDNYVPHPGSHLTNERDCEHYLNSLTIMMDREYKSVLDIGSYDGWHAILLARDEYDVTGVEFIPSLVQAARRYIEQSKVPNVKIIESDWIKAQPCKMCYDLITCYEVLEHVPWDMVTDWVSKMERYGKTIAISLPNQNHEENAQHQWTPTEDLIGEYFSKKRNVKIEYKEWPTTPNVPGNWFITYDMV